MMNAKCLLSVIKYSLLGSLLLSVASCDDEETSSIPNCRVELVTPYSDYMKLRNAGSYVVYEKNGFYAAGTRLGYGGVLIFRDYDGVLHACDLACPVEANESVTVEVSMPYAVCPKCGTKYDLTFGFCSPVNGSSKHTLRIYESVFERGEYIQVRH